MKLERLATLLYIPTAIYFLYAIWSLFSGTERLIFLAELQTALLFLILALLAKNKA